uniref:Reverse transcriptase domain-containing protein n=1 Tax=Tanacetum cinerariifolium TaxID=118510 RepID=A0A699IWJ9_TANCI|nr:reverse transcriptase domain-containing protein [Tanacetum cinerariifolium]
MLKFPTEEGIVTIRSSLLIPAECASVDTSSVTLGEKKAHPANLTVPLHPNFPDQEVVVGGSLSDEGHTELNVREGCPPVRQKKRGQAPECTKAIQAEVEKLVEAGIMREVYYHDWLSNPIMDCYPLPEIDWKVESLCGYPFKCFLDTYKGYHQIQMAAADEEKTAFHTGQGVYCYTKMPFGLKNAGATYQRLMDKAFKNQMGRKLEVYVDDLVVKSHTEVEMVRDIEETFQTPRKINMKLNPKKGSFRFAKGVFLGYVITHEGIKPCPDKTTLVLQLPSPQTIKEVQSLNGKLASLNRFLSKSAEKSLPLFQTLKKCIKKSDFRWTTEAEQAFQQLKQHLSALPLLAAPKPQEELIMYLSATHGAISAVLMTEWGTAQTPVYFISRAESQMGRNIEVYVDDLVVKSHTEAEMMRDIEETFQTLRKINMILNPKKCSFGLAEGVFLGAVLMTEQGTAQTPVYFISCALQGPELNYSPMEKLVLSMVFAAKRLRRYFQAHPITVITDQPIKQVMSRPDVAGRLQKWSIMLGEHNITYRPMTSIKGQILADFLNEMPSNASQGVSVAEIQEEPWTLFTDGLSCVDGSGARLILTNPDRVEFTYALRFQFAASNNEAEYEALIAGLRIATQMGVKNIQANVDSKLVANQVLGAQVPRSRNKKADALSKIASTSFAHLSKQVLVEVLETKSITVKEVTAVIEEESPTWMTKLVNYLKEGILLGDEKEAQKLRLKAQYVMKEIHEGSCSMHAGPRSVVAKAIRLGYFWPTMHKDAHDMIRKCSNCQIHRPVTRHPQQPLTPITDPWLFYKWGINIAGPFSEGTGKVKFLIVAIDYFTKWIEAKAVATITGG